MAADTSLVNVVAFHATASTSHPTIPAKGTNITQANWNAAGFVTGGRKDITGNDMDLGEDTFELPLIDPQHEIIRAPRGDAPDDHVLLSQGAQPFEVPFYGSSETLWALDSNADITSNVFSFTDTSTKRTVAVEVGGGLYLVYYPQCTVKILGDVGGFATGGVALATLRIMPEKTAALSAGFDKEWYQ